MQVYLNRIPCIFQEYKIMTKEKQEISEQIKTDYRAGRFFPKDYKSQNNKPAWLDENLLRNQDAEIEELEAKINEYKNKLGL